MTIGKGTHQQWILFVPLGGAPVSDESDSNSLEVDDSESEGIYMNEPSDDEVGLYAIEAVSKREVSTQRKFSNKMHKGESGSVGWRNGVAVE